MKRREFIIGAASGLTLGFSNHCSAQQNSIREGDPEIKGSLAELQMQTQKPWPEKALKLVYFGLPWATQNCGTDLRLIQSIAIKIDPAGHRIARVFVYPDYTKVKFSEGELKPPSILGTVDAYIKNPNSVFIGVSGPPDKVIKIARSNYGTLYFDLQIRPIFENNPKTLPGDHTRRVYLMTPNLDRNILVFQLAGNAESLEDAMEAALREQIKIHFPSSPAAPAP